MRKQPDPRSIAQLKRRERERLRWHNAGQHEHDVERVTRLLETYIPIGLWKPEKLHNLVNDLVTLMEKVRADR